MHDSRNVPAGGAEGNIGGAERQYSGCERAVPGLNIAGVKEGDYSATTGFELSIECILKNSIACFAVEMDMEL